MKKIALQLIIVVLVTTMISCKNKKESPIVYKTESLIIEQITPSVFKHKSYLQTDSFGKVGCNGMIYISNNEALVFDTPTNDTVSKELIKWIEKEKKARLSGVVVNHFHDDCLGGLHAFHQQDIPSYANNLTITLAKKDSVTVPLHGFDNRLELSLGNNNVITQFFGEGHTKDNTVSYIENEKVLFGGCLIKSLTAGKGYLGNANVAAWSATVQKVKTTFPEIKKVIPGHGKVGDTALLDYTIKMFQE